MAKHTIVTMPGDGIGNQVWGTRELFDWLLEQKLPADSKR